MFTDFNNIDFNNPKDLNNFWDAMERGFKDTDNMSALHTDCPISSREDFADYFSNIADFLHYVREEHIYEQDDYKYSLFMDKDGNIVIEEEPINDLVLFFDVTRTVYPIDESWRYIAMDWFDTVCGNNIWEM